MDFKPGDVVILKSGGPLMTVVGKKSDGIHCCWFSEKDDNFKQFTFPAEMLEKK